MRVNPQLKLVPPLKAQNFELQENYMTVWELYMFYYGKKITLEKKINLYIYIKYINNISISQKSVTDASPLFSVKRK